MRGRSPTKMTVADSPLLSVLFNHFLIRILVSTLKLSINLSFTLFNRLFT